MRGCGVAGLCERGVRNALDPRLKTTTINWCLEITPESLQLLPDLSVNVSSSFVSVVNVLAN